MTACKSPHPHTRPESERQPHTPDPNVLPSARPSSHGPQASPPEKGPPWMPVSGHPFVHPLLLLPTALSPAFLAPSHLDTRSRLTMQQLDLQAPSSPPGTQRLFSSEPGTVSKPDCTLSPLPTALPECFLPFKIQFKGHLLHEMLPTQFLQSQFVSACVF